MLCRICDLTSWCSCSQHETKAELKSSMATGLCDMASPAKHRNDGDGDSYSQ